MRAGRPVSATSVLKFRPPRGVRTPTPTSSVVVPKRATYVIAPPGSYRARAVSSVPSTRPTSRVTAR